MGFMNWKWSNFKMFLAPATLFLNNKICNFLRSKCTNLVKFILQRGQGLI